MKQALGVLRENGSLPSGTSGSATNHTMALLEGIAAPERQSVVVAARFVLPPKVDVPVYDAVVAYLLTLPTEARVPFARSAGLLCSTLRLPAAAGKDYVALLQALHAFPPQHRVPVIMTCRQMQPQWYEYVAPKSWTRCLQALAALPEPEWAQVARDVRSLYAGRNCVDDVEFSLVCVEAHTGLDAAARAVICDQLQKTFGCHPGRPIGSKKLERWFKASPQARAEVAQACDDIFVDGPRETPGERSEATVALLDADDAGRQALKDVLQDLRGIGIELTSWVTGDLKEPWAQSLYGPDERREFLALVGETLVRRVDNITTWCLIQTLLQIPVQERVEAAALARALLDRGSLTWNSAAISILRATPQERRDHLARLQGGVQPGASIGGVTDLENVMQGDLQRQVDQAIAALSQRFAKHLATPKALEQIKGHLEALQIMYQGQPEHTLMRVRGGDTEINNARRTLSGDRREGDFSDSVQKTPDMAKICALVWHATSAKRPKVAASQAAQEQELMRHGLVMALARCIEDDGHRVCGVGQRQYTIDVLKGFYAEAGDAQDSVTPSSPVSVLAQDFYNSHKPNAPTAEQIDAFKTRAHQLAIERYGDKAPRMAEFTEQFAAYMTMTYPPQSE